MTHQPIKHRPPGGLQLDYLAGKPPRPLPLCNSPYAHEWVEERRDALLKIRENGKREMPGQLNSLAEEMIDRLGLLCVGHSPAAWMERTVTTAATLQDYRSRQFGRRLRNPESWASSWVDARTEEWNDPEDESRPLDSVERSQAIAAITFSLEWQHYLIKLLVRPPGDPPFPLCPFPSCYDEPDDYVAETIAQLAHCRPVGAFFVPLTTKWSDGGGRDLCRNRKICPHCHARNATRLVERIQQGPWRPGRWKGRQLAMVRIAVPTDGLALDRMLQEVGRQNLEFEDWLRTSRNWYTADDGDQTMIRNVDVEQSMADTLTPHEVERASQVLGKLVEFARDAGIDGGMRFHSIGPSQRRYLHELCIVGEVSRRNAARFSDAVGITGEAPQIAGQPVEAILLPPGYKHAARLLVAGSSWGYDPQVIGAQLNEAAGQKCYWRHPEAVGQLKRSAGLRGAMAWQPLFLLSSVAFWSRVKVLTCGKFKSHATFGTWRGKLPSDRTYRSVVQHRKWMVRGGAVKAGHARNATLQLQRQIRQASISQAELARKAGCSAASISRFMKESRGSQQLVAKLRAALVDIPVQPRPADSKFSRPADVAIWLQRSQRTQVWLAGETGYSPSQVSRYLSGKTSFNTDFALAVAGVTQRLADETNCIAFTASSSPEVELVQEVTLK